MSLMFSDSRATRTRAADLFWKFAEDGPLQAVGTLLYRCVDARRACLAVARPARPLSPVRASRYRTI